MKLHCTSADVMQRMQTEQERVWSVITRRPGPDVAFVLRLSPLHQSACGNLNRNLCLIFLFLLHEAPTVAKTFPSSDPTSDTLIPVGNVIGEQWQADVFHVGAAASSGGLDMVKQ